MPHGPRIKICGTTSPEDALLAVELGAWAIGLIFHEPSPRYVDLERAGEIAAAVRRRTEIAGVFVNRPLEEVTRVADQLGLTLLQLHGDEGPAYCAQAARRTGTRVIKAARVRSRGDVEGLQAFHTDFHLLDSPAPGSGTTFDWRLARSGSGVPTILSGGLSPANVAEGVARVRPFAVDVASGVESEPGRKDPARLEEFFAAARSAAPGVAAA
jgi:phosphoribosylanthranilate isomerase